MSASSINAQDILIAVVGVTGVGKSTFISHFTDEDVGIGKTLESYTQDVKSFQCSLPGIPKFYLVDTPGFDDSVRSDADVLRSVSENLAASYANGIKLSGIIYLHRIMDVRFGGAAGRNLRVFKRLCGDNNLGSVVLATTFWKNVTPQMGEDRERQLRTDDRFWAQLIQNDSKVFRQDRERESGEEIIRYLVNRRVRVTLSIQDQLVVQGKTLAQTDAGVEVLGEIQELRAQHERQIAAMERDKEQAIKERDALWEAEIRENQGRYRALIERDEKAVGRMRAKWRDIRNEIQFQYADRCVLM